MSVKKIGLHGQDWFDMDMILGDILFCVSDLLSLFMPAEKSKIDDTKYK